MDRDHPRQEIDDAIASGNLHRLLELTGLLHGHYCPGSGMGVKAAAIAMKALDAQTTGMEDVLAIVETNSCFADGVQLVTGCSLGNNGLIYRDFGKTAVTLARRSGEGIRVASRPGSNPVQKNPEAAALFQKVVTERQGTPEDEARLKQLWVSLSFEVLDLPDEELFTISQIMATIPPYARITASADCAVCGERIMEPRARVRDGKPICLGCSNHEYYQLTGNGMELVREGSGR